MTDFLPESDRDSAIDYDLLETIGVERLTVGGNRPLFLNDPDSFWFIEQGRVELFVVELKDGEPVSQRHHIGTLAGNEIMVGCAPQPMGGDRGTSLGLLAVGTVDTRLHRGSLARLAEQSFDLTTVIWLDSWITHLDEVCGRAFKVRQSASLLEADPAQEFAAGDWLGVHHLNVLWIKVEKGSLRYHGEEALPVNSSSLFPVTEWCHLEVTEDCSINGYYSPTVLANRQLWDNLHAYHSHFLRTQELLLEQGINRVEARFNQHQESRREQIRSALTRLGNIFYRHSVLARPVAVSEQGAIASICEVIGQKFDYEISNTVLRQNLEGMKLVDILRRAGFRFRKVKLSGDKWYRRDSGTCIAVMKEDGRPIALLPQNGRHYVVHDPMGDGSYRFEPEMTAWLLPQAFMVYPPMHEGIKSLKEIFLFGLHDLWNDMWLIAALALLSGLFSILTPIFTSRILTLYIPNEDFSMFYSALAALFAAMIGRTLFSIANFTALTRIAGRMSLVIQSSLWGRLLQLPVNFFRIYTAGELANRANGINEIRIILTATTVTAFISTISGLINFFLMSYYSWRLTIIATLLVAVMALFSVFIIRKQLPYQREQFALQGRIDGMVFQILGGVSKLRVANRESFGFAHWAKSYAEQKDFERKILSWRAVQATVNAVFQPLSTVTLFAFIVYVLLSGAQPEFDLASFIAFNAAFGQFSAAMLSMAATLATVIEVIPLYERVKPIIDETPERSTGRMVLETVRGDIEFTGVWFSYSSEAGPILRDVNFHIRPGDYVAFVGESGAGKSTVARMMLSFCEPTSGSIFIDGHDLSELNIVEFRRQVGVVLQESQLLSGSILENIRSGLMDLSLDQAWEAADKAGLSDDIHAMPLGMHTVLPEGGVGLSGGQRQRLMIARALARQARVLLFDEATSALDNVTQAIVKKTLGGLNITRIVIAHRLSTIRDVDKIYVIKRGEIIETGTYKSLMAQGGHFADLAQRQVL